MKTQELPELPTHVGRDPVLELLLRRVNGWHENRWSPPSEPVLSSRGEET